MSDAERENHLFRIPDDPKRFGALPELSLGPQIPGDPAQESKTTMSQSVIDPSVNSQTNMMTNSQMEAMAQ